MTHLLLPLRWVRLLALLLGLALAAAGLTGCGAASAQSGDASQVLRIPYEADMGPPDPDIFYGIEGNTVIQSVYQGLVQYSGMSDRIVPDLATRWTISPDRRTYTFDLRSGVHFQDGTPMTSHSWVASINRRKHVNNASVYMVTPIASMATPSATQLVIHLSHPVGAFMDYLASTYGPKAIGPDAIATHAGKDFGQTWLRTHGDGTGPYELSSFQTSQEYVMVRNPHYWGTAAHFAKVIVSIVPSANNQFAQLQQGGQDMILHSFPISELPSAQSDKSIRVLSYPSNLMTMLFTNPQRPPFSSIKARQALSQALNISALLRNDFGGTATPARGAYPASILPAQAPLHYHYNPEAARATFSHLAQRSVTIGYVSDSSGVDYNLAQSIQNELDAVGLHVSVQQYQVSQTYGFAAHATSRTAAPDLLIADNTPDAAHPDTWARINFGAKGGLNYFGWDNPKVNTLLAKAIQQPTPADEPTYREIGQVVTTQDPVIFLGDLKDVILVRSDLAGITHVTAYPWAFNVADLKRGG